MNKPASSKKKWVTSHQLWMLVFFLHPLISFLRTKADAFKPGDRVKITEGRYARHSAKILSYYRLNFYVVRVSRGVGKRTLHRYQLKEIKND